ncbi:recombinase family protein [Frigidibacter albus]|uniref:recombinase family protein n=1 Tax=Frigidibacter albus TaxID=1465486 RepID=UPI00147860EA|nr:recombinase family protein [Frigidibacter albus]
MTTRPIKKYVIYYRVSTKRQGESGLGLEAQERDVALFLTQFSPEPYEVVGTFTDVKSGAKAARPELAKAIEEAKAHKAELLVAKLDRLSRKVSQIATLMEEKGLTIRVAAMPTATPFQLHIYAALAEQERVFIGARTRAALTSAKARGVKLGGLRENTRTRNVEAVAAADAAAQQVASIILPMRKAKATLAGIADALNDAKVPTQRGGKWHPSSVKNVLSRLAC